MTGDRGTQTVKGDFLIPSEIIVRPTRLHNKSGEKPANMGHRGHQSDVDTLQ